MGCANGKPIGRGSDCTSRPPQKANKSRKRQRKPMRMFLRTLLFGNSKSSRIQPAEIEISSARPISPPFVSFIIILLLIPNLAYPLASCLLTLARVLCCILFCRTPPQAVPQKGYTTSSAAAVVPHSLKMYKKRHLWLLVITKKPIPILWLPSQRRNAMKVRHAWLKH